MAEPYDVTSAIIEYEDGDMPFPKIVELFQYLVDQRMISQLQGSYGRMAQRLIEAGEVHPKVRAA